MDFDGAAGAHHALRRGRILNNRAVATDVLQVDGLVAAFREIVVLPQTHEDGGRGMGVGERGKAVLGVVAFQCIQRRKTAQTSIVAAALHPVQNNKTDTASKNSQKRERKKTKLQRYTETHREH